MTDQKAIVLAVAAEVKKKYGLRKLPFTVGTMIEVPRAAITADEIAAEAEFFSFGTNDLTQMCCGFSRDDAGSFLPAYVEKKIYADDPFISLDTAGVGKLMRIAVQLGRGARPGLKMGICGEHGGDPASIRFCHDLGLDYVSCSPFRVPIARLAAAQAELANPRGAVRKARRRGRRRSRSQEAPLDPAAAAAVSRAGCGVLSLRTSIVLTSFRR